METITIATIQGRAGQSCLTWSGRVYSQYLSADNPDWYHIHIYTMWGILVHNELSTTGQKQIFKHMVKYVRNYCLF